MTLQALLLRSFDSAALCVGISSCVLTLTPRALQAWEEELAEAAARACMARGGAALLGTDRVVSCAPSVLANGSAP